MIICMNLTFSIYLLLARVAFKKENSSPSLRYVSHTSSTSEFQIRTERCSKTPREFLFGICRSMEWKNEEKKKNNYKYSKYTTKILETHCHEIFPPFHAAVWKYWCWPRTPKNAAMAPCAMSHFCLPNVINAPGHDSVSGHVLLHENHDSSSEATWYVYNIYMIPKIQQESHCSSQQEGWGLHTIQMLPIRLLPPTILT